MWKPYALIKKGSYHFLILLFTGIALISILKQHAKLSSADYVSIEPALKDLGKVRFTAKPLQLSFQLINKSNDKIAITGISTSCGCTSAGITGSNSLLPKEKKVLNVLVDNSDRIGVRHLKISVAAVTAEGREISSDANIVYDAITSAMVDQSFLKLGINYIGQELNHVTLQLDRGEAPVNWNGIDISGEHLKTTVSRVSEDRYLIDAALDSTGSIIGPMKSDLKINLTNQGTRVAGETLDVPVDWQVRDPNLNVSPSAIYLGVMSRNSIREGEIRLIPLTKDALQGMSATSTSSQISVRMGQIDGSLRSIYRVRAPSQNGGFSAMIETKIVFAGTELLVRTPVVGFVE